MSMRSQVYDWDASRGTAMTVSTSAGKRTSIFIGGVGNNITKPAETSATEFVVIEDIAVTPTLPIGVDAVVPDQFSWHVVLVRCRGHHTCHG